MRTGAFLAAVVAIVAAGCASAPVHRGVTAPNIHQAISEVLVADGYVCKPSPDRAWVDCTHAEMADVSFAYLNASNMLQVWSLFNRKGDEGLAAKWRADTCDGVVADIAAINDETIIKVVCTTPSLRFETTTWVPDAGLSNDDLRGIFGVFTAVLGETIRGRGFLNEEATPAEPAVPAEAATTPEA